VGTWLGSALLAMIVLQNGQADFASRLAGFGLSPDAIAHATSAVDTVLRADPAPSQSIAPGALLEGALLGTYFESYTVGLSSALVWAASICICMAVIVWIVFRSPAAPPGHG
jgi:hypothetical protein